MNVWRTTETVGLLQQLQKDMREEFGLRDVSSDKDRVQYQEIDDRLTVLYTELIYDLTLAGQVNADKDVLDVISQRSGSDIANSQSLRLSPRERLRLGDVTDFP